MEVSCWCACISPRKESCWRWVAGARAFHRGRRAAGGELLVRVHFTEEGELLEVMLQATSELGLVRERFLELYGRSS